jgi:crotonobetaine/carnitine-CoA ligase
MPHAHCFLYGLGTIDALQLTPEDRYYIVLPLFHANGLLMQLGAALIAGYPRSDPLPLQRERLAR